MTSPSAEEAVAAAFRASESQEGDFMGKVTPEELAQIARLKVDHAHARARGTAFPKAIG